MEEEGFSIFLSVPLCFGFSMIFLETLVFLMCFEARRPRRRRWGQSDPSPLVKRQEKEKLFCLEILNMFINFGLRVKNFRILDLKLGFSTKFPP